jgi:mannonate dehydratase
LLTHSKERAAEDSARTLDEAVAPYGQVSAEEMWERVRYMYERVIPVAEEAGVNVGAHPDDPPERHYRGVEQILNTPEGLKRLTELVPSPRSGLLLCLGTLHEMGTGPQDTMAAIEYFLERNKIFSAHFRNPKGTVPTGGYQEDFLDEGDLDMLAVMRLLHQHNYQGSLDPDHAIGIAGDTGGRIAFAWELGYMKALRAAVQAGN